MSLLPVLHKSPEPGARTWKIERDSGKGGSLFLTEFRLGLDATRGLRKTFVCKPMRSEPIFSQSPKCYPSRTVENRSKVRRGTQVTKRFSSVAGLFAIV